ncbi:hypothetical protein AcV5_008377 [Taiwanofungus camphoratus]|nr:hypothetical protein AcV5_008377 [Antrodia cinnamomea]
MVNPTAARGPYNLPPAVRGVDDLTYNPQADAQPDNAEFDPAAVDPESQLVGARGADNQPTYRDYGQEDVEAARSDETQQIPRSEVDDLLDSTTDAERNVGGGKTRGKRVDAWKQDRDVDQFLDQTGIASADRDVEISAATGR